ncbi:MAG TPA: hypothetical protein VEC12_09385 [Bacteroidia bacterium]|nr:hypothetical protein [Bacteroidia bacterium]
MKKSILILAAIFTLGLAADAATVSTVNYAVENNDEKVKITAEELPQAVKDVLAGADYKDWSVSEVYLVKATAEYYEISLKKGEETKVVNLDKDGKTVEKK